ncbi:MAG: complex I NDUFA9 subunit family protein [Proteobacteria bacterium]|nr:complex I NDUFA9 subunit family protein [Pseudomonadota bacterium]
MGKDLVTVFGGSGFVGRHVVKRLAANGAAVRVAVRDPEAAMFLRPMGNVGRIELVQANIRDGASVASAVQGAAAVVNLVGILAERGRQRFNAVHAEGAARVAQAAAMAGARWLVHVSALGADPAAPSRYGRSKASGEERVRAAFPDATILRPGIVFGSEDGFLNRFGELARIKPFVLPVVAAATRVQPIYVGDVAAAVTAAVASDDARGRTFELGGPEVWTLREIAELVLRDTGRSRTVLPLPSWVAALAAAASAVLPLPRALHITFDQLRQLRVDNVAGPGAAGLSDLGVAATPLAAVLPGVLARFRIPDAPNQVK